MSGKKGYKHTEETKLKISIKRKLQLPPIPKGSKLSEEHKKKIGWGNSGKKLTEETKTKISNSLKGNNHPNKAHFKKGYTPWNKGKKCPQLSGKKSHFWCGGISANSYSKDWVENFKNTIRKRDYYNCRLCGKPQKNDISHIVHHIDYNKQNCNQNNLITLCRSCHAKTNKNRKKWINFFNLLLSFEDDYAGGEYWEIRTPEDLLLKL